jgi:hypothetical protein
MADLPGCERQMPRQRWRPRFGLRSFLLLFAIFSLLLGLVGGEVGRVQRQRAIVWQLNRANASVTYDYQSADGRSSAQPAILTWLRECFGPDLFAEVAFVRWDYQFRTIAGSDIELIRALPSVREVGFFASGTATARPQLPTSDEESRKAGERNIRLQAASLGMLNECKNLRQLTLFGGFATDAHLIALQSGCNLRSLELLYAPNVTDDGVMCVGDILGLEELEIRNSPGVTDKWTIVLPQLSRLSSLDLSGTAVTDAALAHIGELPNLERLGLNQNSITDEGIYALRALSRLKALELGRTKITDAALKTVGSFSDLQVLDISDTSVTDAGMKYIANLAHLAELKMRGTGVTEEGLLQLQQITNLRRLDITLSEKVSSEGLRRFKRFVPACLIECAHTDPQTGELILQAWE